MAENFLAKKIGPFSGGVWIVVVGGGIGLALLIKKGMGGGTPPANQPILVENVPIRGGVSAPVGDDPRIPPKEPPKLPPAPTLPKPVIPPPPVPSPNRGALPVPVPAKPPTPAPKPPPPPPPRPPVARPPTANYPGGGTGTCQDTTGYFPPDYIARKNMSTARFIDRAIKLSWAVQNIAAGPSGIFAFTTYVSSPVSWPLINTTRKNRGLRPLSTGEFQALAAKLNSIAGSLQGKENRLTNAQILEVWEQFNTPFVCASFPSRSGSRATVRTGVA